MDSINTIYKLSDNLHSSRTFPLLTVESSNSITLRKSIKFRATKAWNSLPKEWNLYRTYDDNNINNVDELIDNRMVGDKEFKKKVFCLLIEQRSNLWFNL